jgi:hypothetical protein
MPQDVETSRIANAAIAPEEHEEIESGPIEELAKHLHWALEKYDPTDDSTWDDLDDHQREIHRATIRSLLCRRGLLLMALRDRSRPSDSIVRRHAETGEQTNTNYNHLKGTILYGRDEVDVM